MSVGILVFGLISTAVVAQAANPHAPYLVLDAGGHTAAVNKVRFIDDERLVSVSNDKTVRIWSMPAGETMAVLRPPLGAGPAGMLYALDVSPGSRWLAVGGYEYSGEDHGIYLIDLESGQIRAVLRGHTNVVIDVAFSADGRWLASASADQTARVWDVNSRRCVATLRGHRDGVYAVAFAPDGQRIATASLDKTARIWSAPGGAELLTLPPQPAPVQAIAWSSDGRLLATGCGDESITLWSREGKSLRRFANLGNQVTSIRFSGTTPRRLFFTLGGEGPRDGGFLIDLASNRIQVGFTEHTNSVLDGALSQDGQLAATADASGEIAVWRIANGSLVHRLKGRGVRPWSAAWDSRRDAISWGATSRFVALNERGPLEFAFDLDELDFVPVPGDSLRTAQTRLGNITVTSIDSRSLSILRAGRDPVRLVLPGQRDEVRSFTLLDDRHIAVGSDFGLYVFDAFDEKRPRRLLGHEGTVWALAPSAHNRYLLSAADDQTLRIWNWNRGELLLSLFFADRQWIAWTPQGFYAASPAGERLMGWHVATERDSLADFYPAAQFRDSLYRPDVVRQLLKTGSVAAALSALHDATPTAIRVGSVEEVLPPIVSVTQPATSPVEIEGRQLQVQAKAQSRSEHPITSLRLLLDGRPYEGMKGVYVVPVAMAPGRELSGQWTIELEPGRHALVVQAETAVSKGLSAPLEIMVRETAVEPAEAARLPDLYIVAVGIQDYPGALRLNFAAKDAESIAGAFQSAGRTLFRDIKVQLITNQQATRRQILSGLSWLRREMTQRDVAIFFYSGHGAKDETGNFYLVPVDGEPSDLLSTAVAGTQFKDALAAIPGRVLVMLDACHAGAAGGDQRKAVYVLTDDLIRDLVTDDYGVIVMCSSMGREFSLESEQHQQGYFTLALVEALKGQADFNKDQLIYLTEIDSYVADRVKALTQGMQHPVTTKPATIRSFPLSKVAQEGLSP